MIKIIGVNKKYGNKQILQNINLDIHLGDIYGLIGLSGAGKSTLLRIINGLEQANGKVITRPNVNIGFVFQNFNLISSLTVYQNVMIALHNADYTPKMKEHKVNEVIELVGLSQYRDCYPKQLSGGQKQRIGIARALAGDVSILLCDEATSALDPFTAQDIINLLTELNSKLGLTIVFVSHQIELVKNFCDKVAIIDSGQIYQSGNVIDVFSKPQDAVTLKLLATNLSINLNAIDKRHKVVTLYSHQERDKCLSYLLSNKVDIEAINDHITKNGYFCHIFINTTKKIKFQTRSLHELQFIN